MADEETSHGKKILTHLQQQMLNNTRKKIPVFTD